MKNLKLNTPTVGKKVAFVDTETGIRWEGHVSDVLTSTKPGVPWVAAVELDLGGEIVLLEPEELEVVG